MTDESPFSKNQREFRQVMLMYREYGTEQEEPSLARIDAMLREKGLEKDYTAKECLRWWHWRKVTEDIAWKVIDHALDATLFDASEDLSADQVEKAIQAYMDKHWQPFSEQLALDWHTPGLGLTKPEFESAEDEAEWVSMAQEWHEQSVVEAVSVTPEQVVQMWQRLKKFKLRPFYE